MNFRKGPIEQCCFYSKGPGQGKVERLIPTLTTEFILLLFIPLSETNIAYILQEH